MTGTKKCSPPFFYTGEQNEHSSPGNRKLFHVKESTFIAALHHEEIKSNPERISNIRKYGNNYNSSGFKFLVAVNKIGEFEKNNDISVYLIRVKGRKLYIQRKSKYDDGKKVIVLLLICTLSKTTPSTGHGGQFFQLIGLSPGNTYQLKELATTSC